MNTGDPVRGIFNGTATTAQPLVLYEQGTNTVRTLASDEVLEVDSAFLANPTTAENTHLFCSTDATPSAGETILRFRTNTGLFAAAMTFGRGMCFAPGATPRVIGGATATNMNAIITGRIRKV